MTHDDLLAKITKLDKSFSHPDSVFSFNDKQNKALRAVVELHYEKSFGEDSPIKNVCDTCSKIYPCPTIQAIEKELSV